MSVAKASAFFHLSCDSEKAMDMPKQDAVKNNVLDVIQLFQSWVCWPEASASCTREVPSSARLWSSREAKWRMQETGTQTAQASGPA